MLQSEKTPKRSSATIRKDLAEKAAAEVKDKGGEVGQSFEKQLKRAREDNPAVLNKIKKATSTSTPGASAGHQQMRIAGRNEKIGVSLCLDLVNPLSAVAGFTTLASRSRLAGSEVDGLKCPYSRKQEEVKRAKKFAIDADNISLHSTIVNELETKAIIMTQTSRIQQLELDLKTTNQRATDAETAKKEAEEAQKKADESAKKADEALKNAQTDLGTLKGVSEENTKLKTKVQRLEKEASQAQINFAATLEAEQNLLVAESDADNDARMKIA
ncbi:uncharacterized protein LOC110713296 [Chenopodium quinoa]|uniref:uncharacterized protein LOC110713296 n=1 Tax=Chenopodium quinoa TaxID=63459 RepID=UPI000B798F26|nr:uncharacterized protein LOC110713296 [Chenopodium quinoa]